MSNPVPRPPAFLSRKSGPDNIGRPLGREAARRILMRAFEAAGIANDRRLGTHTLRKTWAANVYASANNDIMLLKAALGHQNVATTQRYLEVDRHEVMAAIKAIDFTRKSHLKALPPLPTAAPLTTARTTAA